MHRSGQPAWVCESCGTEWGHKECGLATWHYGDECGVCGDRDVPVTEPRDFGFLRAGWQLENLRD
jgi:hypothetical protein